MRWQNLLYKLFAVLVQLWWHLMRIPYWSQYICWTVLIMLKAVTINLIKSANAGILGNYAVKEARLASVTCQTQQAKYCFAITYLILHKYILKFSKIKFYAPTEKSSINLKNYNYTKEPFNNDNNALDIAKYYFIKNMFENIFITWTHNKISAKSTAVFRVSCTLYWPTIAHANDRVVHFYRLSEAKHTKNRWRDVTMPLHKLHKIDQPKLSSIFVSLTLGTLSK